MTPSEIELDHAVALVADLRDAAAAYGRLGFTVSPRGSHGEAIGTANHVIELENAYFELLAIVSRGGVAAARFQPLLDTAEGLWLMALRASSAEETYCRLSASGLEPTAPVTFSRVTTGTAGGHLEKGFCVTALPFRAEQGAGVFFCEHLSVPGSQSRPPEHPNGATRLEELVFVAELTDDLASFHRRVLDGECVDSDARVMSAALGNLSVSFLNHEAAKARYGILGPGAVPSVCRGIGASFRVASLERARHSLTAGRVRFLESEGRIVVDPRSACGVIMEFRERRDG